MLAPPGGNSNFETQAHLRASTFSLDICRVLRVGAAIAGLVKKEKQKIEAKRRSTRSVSGAQWAEAKKGEPFSVVIVIPLATEECEQL